jgi:hypothetical protein
MVGFIRFRKSGEVRMLQCVIQRPVNGLIGVRFVGDTRTVSAAKVAEALMGGSVMIGKTGPEGITYLVPTSVHSDADEIEACAHLQKRIQMLICRASVERRRPALS